MSATLRLSSELVVQADRADRWWREHRPAAPSLFAQELATTLARIRDLPLSGRPFPRPRHPQLRRAELARTRYFVVYEYDEVANTVLVHTVWSPSRRRSPPLP
jgi:plasmid stabilization system protein ParE